MKTTEDINSFLYTWNPSQPEHLKVVKIEDDVREVIQSVYVRRLSLTEREELLTLSAKIGIHASMLGFPAASQKEYEDCQALIRHIRNHGLSITPICLARTIVNDLKPIVTLNQEFQGVQAEIFIGTSPLRRKVEQWDFETMLHRIKTCGKYLFDNKTNFGLSLEDASRTPPKDIEWVIRTAIDTGAASISICDTAGDCIPDGAAKLTEFCIKQIEKAGIHIGVVWHGHNDKGLSLANAMAAAMAGAEAISGTFSGFGERAGNTPLEQVIMLLFQAGNRQFCMGSLFSYCRKVAEYTRVPIPENTPLIGSKAFSTSAGSHASAIFKAKQIGPDFEDYVFSGVPARLLGRIQEVLIGPTSGKANARYILGQLGITATEELVQQLVKYAKTKDRLLTDKEIRQYIETANTERL